MVSFLKVPTDFNRFNLTGLKGYIFTVVNTCVSFRYKAMDDTY